MKVDYIIVGLGLAGLAFAEELIRANNSFVVFEDNSQTSSLVAGGVYNPVILKRFTPVWNAKSQLDIALPFYKSLEQKLAIRLDYQFPIRKVFKSIEDQNNWFIASDKPVLAEFMNPEIIHEAIYGIKGDHGSGEVFGTGRIDTLALVNAYREYLKSFECIQFEKFEHEKIVFSKNGGIRYKSIEARKIVFCEGYGIKQNPFFNELPLQEAKGELLIIHVPKLNVDFLVKSTLFILPLGDDLYKVGATFNWKDKTSTPSEEGRKELIEKLEKVLSLPYTIISQSAGIRPAVKDRRPLVGVHPEHKELLILNGLGTRGVMISPSMAHELYQHAEFGKELDKEININRFNKKPHSSK
ncbi:MAG: FAD-binding oxidoreductase [Flavobacteriaceae bacterium]|nr:FAD-binding oxidoreductase [Flavobacteriaceae bacterium]